MGYSQGHDRMLFLVGTHTVMHDRLQLVIQHPSTCSNKGARRDKYKTFHRWTQALSQLVSCGETLSGEQLHQIETTGKLVDAAPR